MESRTAAACQTEHGVAGSLHVFGAGRGPYAGGVSEAAHAAEVGESEQDAAVAAVNKAGLGSDVSDYMVVQCELDPTA